MKNSDVIYLAGGCFWGMEEYIARLKGVFHTEVGYANAKREAPSYEQVCTGSTGAAETVKVEYDKTKLSLEQLLEAYFDVIDPTILNRQGNDRGSQYRTGIYYTKEEDAAVIKNVMGKQQDRYEEPIVTEVKPLKNFYPAEEYHQNYLKKNPGDYCHIDVTRADRYNEEKLKRQSLKELIQAEAYTLPSEEEQRKMLSKEQYQVTRENATERPYENAYFDNHAKGLYVDVITGEPLFSSADKYDSFCGWPSFTSPIIPDVVNEYQDNSHGMKRIEVRSRVGDAHLGHVFTDGPEEKGGLRYCINSASIRFIPYEDLEKEGYGELIDQIKW